MNRKNLIIMASGIVAIIFLSSMMFTIAVDQSVEVIVRRVYGVPSGNTLNFIDSQFMIKYPALQNGLNESDKKYENVVIRPCETLICASDPVPIDRKYQFQISSSIAKSITSDPSLKFDSISLQDNPNAKIYGTYVKRGDNIYSIIIYLI